MATGLLDQILSTAGAFMVLGAYAANLLHYLDRDGVWYSLLNLVGASLLAYAAVKSGALGLILVEVAWAAVSAGALVRALTKRAAR